MPKNGFAEARIYEGKYCIYATRSLPFDEQKNQVCWTSEDLTHWEKHEDIIVRNPFSTRPYQHVLEPLFAYLMIAAKQYEDNRFAGYYNVGPDDCDCVTTGELCDLFCKYWGDGAVWENQAEANAPHEANFLKLDCSKIKAVFGWKPRWHIAQCMEMTCRFGKVWLSGGDIPAEMDAEIKEFLGE